MMFDPAKIGALLAARRPGHGLPQGLYNDPDAFVFDLEAIFARSWNMVGFEVELPRPGAWMAAPVGPWSVIITRDRRGDLNAFHNTCRHRGARLCQPGKGAAPRLVCPYHRWTYELSGELAHAARMPPSFDRARHGLFPVHLESVGGVLYVCLADDPPPIAEFKRELEPLLAPHNLARSKLAFESVIVEKANWKLAMENARECYHCPTAHPELAQSFPVGASAHFDFGEDRRQEEFAARMKRLGLPIGPVEGHWWQAIRFTLNEGFKSMTVDGRHSVGKLMCEAGDGDIGSLRWSVEPHGFAHATADQLFMFTVVPVAPRETMIVSKWLVHEEAVEGVDYQIDDLARLWTATNLQDRALVENNQAGVDSPAFTPGPFSPEAEALAIRFVDWYCAAARSYLDEIGSGRRRRPEAARHAAG
jgi:Rieske 2Fe-2S family protein